MDTKELLGRFMAGYLGLEYHGRPLSSTPSNMSLEAVVKCLLAHQAFTVVLEPGDATRYVLTLLPLGDTGFQHQGYNEAELLDCWLVVREDRGDFIGVVANTQWDFAHHNLGGLPRGNEHTGNIFVAWLSLVFSAMREAEGPATQQARAEAAHGSP